MLDADEYALVSQHLTFADDGAKPLPLTGRFDVVNLIDTIYQLRDGSGIGVAAPQYGLRRGVFVG